MVDTHSHIGLRDDDAAALVRSAAAVGVERILTVGLDEESNRRYASRFQPAAPCFT